MLPWLSPLTGNLPTCCRWGSFLGEVESVEKKAAKPAMKMPSSVREAFGLKYKPFTSQPSPLPPSGDGFPGHFAENILGHFHQPFGCAHRTGPAMSLGSTIGEKAVIVRGLGLLHPFLQFASRAIGEEVVGVAHENVDLVGQLGTESRPVLLEKIPQVVMVFPILRDSWIHRAGTFIEQRIEIAVF